MTFISVDLPAPFSPRTAWTSPRRASRSTPASAATAPKRLAMPRRARTGRHRRRVGNGLQNSALGGTSVPARIACCAASTFAFTAGGMRLGESGVVLQRDDAVLHAHLLDACDEGVVLHLARDGQKGARDVDHGAGENDVRRDVVLVLVGAEGADLPLLARPGTRPARRHRRCGRGSRRPAAPAPAPLPWRRRRRPSCRRSWSRPGSSGSPPWRPPRRR